MPRTQDWETIRAVLEQDREWSAYALGDLAPGLFEDCEWFVAQEAPALLLIYRGLREPVLFAQGPPSLVAGLLAEIAAEPRLYLMVRPEIVPFVQERWVVPQPVAMWRMVLDTAAFRRASGVGATRLSIDDLPALRELYADGVPAGETPDSFDSSMLDRGIFYGVFEDAALVAAAGTHLVSPSVGVGAVGNVYTRRDRRGRGLATCVTGAVTAALLRLSLPTVVLNVSQQNEAALLVYERLGFRRYGGFFEGLAVSGPARARAQSCS